ncbi:MAG TPA: single-stranded DNA-binding protein [Trebonia sp.]|nr:single-stranded DNA-binding protein [Trebonia sp.]
MSQGNYIMLTGFVARDPELHITKKTKTAVVKVRVGSSSRYLNRGTGEWVEGEVSYFDVTCWRHLAMNVKASLHKGDKVTLQGKFRASTWTDSENRPRVSIEIIADAVGHNLVAGWTIYNRAATNPSRVQEELESGELARGDTDGDADSGEPDSDGGFASDYLELADRPSELAGQPEEGAQPLADGEQALEEQQRTAGQEAAVDAPF